MSYKCPATYILANKRNGTLYTGVTGDLIQRIYEHKYSDVKGFAKRYNCNQLVYYEIYETVIAAIEREKQIKAGSRKKKMTLIEQMNPEWIDLYKLLSD